MFVPQSVGSNSLKYSADVLWNNHLKIDEKINSFTKIGPFKNSIFHPIMRNKLISSLHYFVYYYLIMLLLLILLLSLV